MHAREYSRVWVYGMMSNVEPDVDILDSNRPSDPNCDSVYLTPKSGHYTDGSIKLTEDNKFICVLSVGAKFLYVIPGFDVLGVELWHIQVKRFFQNWESREHIRYVHKKWYVIV